MRLAAPVLAILLCACAPRLRVRPQTQGFNSANLGLSVSLIAPIAVLRLEPTVIYFARVDEVNGLFQPNVFASDYKKGGLYYASNVDPGTYVAVGAQVANDKDAAFTIYFSSGLIERTKTTVGVRELAFMGDHWVYMIPGLWGADAAQKHYAGLIAHPRLKPGILNSLIGSTYYRGVMMRSRKDEGTRDAFFLYAKEDLDLREAAIPGVRVAERFFWAGSDGNLGLEIKARFQSQKFLERMLRPDMVIGGFNDKNPPYNTRDWTLREILVSVNMNAAETAAVWRVSGPRPLITAYVEALVQFSKKYPLVQDVNYSVVEFRPAAN